MKPLGSPAATVECSVFGDIRMRRRRVWGDVGRVPFLRDSEIIAALFRRAEARRFHHPTLSRLYGGSTGLQPGELGDGFGLGALAPEGPATRCESWFCRR